jgi:predicted metalloprotease with PDZ domain
VVALNVRREIVDKVGRSGIDSLSAEEKREIPQKLDLSDEAYRARLKQVFDRHQGAEKKNFDFFHQAQVLWDETMAESADRFLQNRADYRLIVLAGGGHLQYGSGIPKRVFQRNGLPFAIVLNDADIEKDIADFIVFPTPSSGAVAPKLMVGVEEQDKKVRITAFSKNSVAEKAGLKVQDALLSLDGEPVESIADVKIALFFKKPGDTIKVKAQRSDPTQGEQQLDFDVKLE